MAKLLNTDASPGANDEFRRRLLGSGLSSVSLFFCELMAREEIKGRPCSAVAGDVHAAYRRWCARLGIRPCAVPHFVQVLRTRHGVSSKRLSYVIEGERKGPDNILVLNTEASTLGAQIAAFRRFTSEPPEPDPISAFYFALKRGEIRGMPNCPALSVDVYECYSIWCARVGASAITRPRFINALNRQHQVTNARWRYFDEFNVEHGPHGILMLGDEELPPADNRAAWLGENIARFKTALKDLRGGLFNA